MKSCFTAGFFKQNRERLRQLCPDARLIVVTANGQLQRNGDSTYPFRQDSSFWYLTGLNQADIVLVMDGADEYLIIPDRHEIVELFDGSHDEQAMHARSGIGKILPARIGWRDLFGGLRRHRHVGTLSAPPGYVKFQEFYTNPARAALLRRLKGAVSGLEVRDVRPELMSMRLIKQAPELAALQKAVDITVATLQEISAEHFSQFRYEYEVEAALSQGFRRRGAAGHSFTPIVAGGRNACQIHYLANADKLDRKGLLLLDVGAEVENYAADLSRTFRLDPPSRRQAEVYDALLDVHRFGIGRLKPGVTFRECDHEIRRYMGEKLVGLGLIRGNDEQSVKRYYPHYSHFLGLDVHDAGDYGRPFEPDMVVTMEPGIYIPEESIGVRVEDDVLITDKGNRVLSAALSTGL